MKEVCLSTSCDLIHKEISELESIAKTSTTSDLQLHPKVNQPPTLWSHFHNAEQKFYYSYLFRKLLDMFFNLNIIKDTLAVSV